MTQEFNLGRALAQVSRTHPSAIAVLAENVAMSYEQLNKLVENFALHMQREGIDRNSLVAVYSDDLLVVLASLFATAHLGCRWTRLNDFLLERRKLDVTHFLHTKGGEQAISRDQVVVDASWALPPEGANPQNSIEFEGYSNADDTWLIVQTSGTTGTPKYVECSQKMMLKRSEIVADDFVAEQTKSVCVFPNLSFPYITRALACLVNGCTIVESLNPVFWVRSEVNLVTGSPKQISMIFSEVSVRSKIAQLHVGGAQLSDFEARELLENFTQVVDLYGSTEANRAYKNIKSIDENNNLKNTAQQLDTLIEIVDREDNPVEAGTEGIIRLQNGYMAQGYLGSPEAAEKSFRHGWFYPGDLGILDETGALTIRGRTNDQFNIGGTKINALEVDFALLEVEGVRDAMSFIYAKPDGPMKLYAFLSVDQSVDTSKIEALATKSCMEVGGENAVPTKFLYAETLPRSVNGKPNRMGCVVLVDAVINPEFGIIVP